MNDVVPLTEQQKHLAVTHIGLAQSIAIRFHHKLPLRIDLDEVQAVAYQGLVSAAQRYDLEYRPPNDPEYDPFLAFGSFARTRITGSIQDWLRKMDYVPRRQRRLFKDAAELSEGRTEEQVADLLGVGVQKVREVRRAVAQYPVSLTLIEDMAETYEEDASKDVKVPHSHDGPEDAHATRTIQQAMVSEMELLPPFDKSVVALRYFSGYDFNQIAAALGSSVSTVKMIHQEAVRALHAGMRRAAEES